MLIDPVVELLFALLSHPRLRTAHDMQIALRSLQRFAAGLLWDKVDEVSVCASPTANIAWPMLRIRLQCV